MAREAAKGVVARLLEGYVLAALERLPPGEEAALKVLVRRAFGKSGDWKKRVREELGFNAGLDAQLIAMWGEAQRVATERGSPLEPQAFARWVVEENFVDAVELVSTSVESELKKGDD
jgi:hypothetical protein